MKIQEVLVKGNMLVVRYKSEQWKFYMKKADILPMMKGVQPIPKTVIEFMRKHPNRVR